MKKIFLIICMSILYISCNPKESNDFICIENTTESIIYFCISEDYPDTLLPKTNKYLNLIEPNSIFKLGNPDDWNRDFQNVFPHDTLIIFFFDNNIINNNNWETIYNEYLIKEKRFYSKNELKNKNWTIIYP
jgi:hypothetical protein